MSEMTGEDEEKPEDRDGTDPGRGGTQNATGRTGASCRSRPRRAPREASGCRSRNSRVRRRRRPRRQSPRRRVQLSRAGDCAVSYPPPQGGPPYQPPQGGVPGQYGRDRHRNSRLAATAAVVAGPPPKKRGNGWKWALGAVALLAVIGVTAAVTISVTKDGGNDDPTPARDTFGLASADDKGPANIITEDPSCAAWRPISPNLRRHTGKGLGQPRSSYSCPRLDTRTTGRQRRSRSGYAHCGRPD